jgi:mannose-6-phosphate isomerase-like protein (cupin superfamily)
MAVWQVAAGSAGRDYTDRFLRHGMAFVGGEIQCSTMDNGVQLGDTIILKKGMSQIVAVGRVVARGGQFKGDGDKDWLQDFDGWDLPAWCYLDWFKPSETIQTHGLTRATIQGVNQTHLLEVAGKVLNSMAPMTTYEAADRTEIVATREQTGGSIGVFRQTIAPKSGPPTHVHQTEDELFYVVSGDFRVKLGDHIMSAPAQTVMFVLRGTPHTFQNVGPEPGVLLVGVTPGGFENYSRNERA